MVKDSRIPFKTAYMAPNRVMVTFSEPTLTKQAFKDSSDINLIMARYEKSGLLDHVNVHQGQYGDYTELGSYHDALNQVIRADEMFMTLPSKVRARFANDPGQFLTFVNDKSNYDEAVSLGLIEPKINTADEPILDPKTDVGVASEA